MNPAEPSPGSIPLPNPKHEKFALMVASKEKAAAGAYRANYPKAKASSAESEGPSLARRPQVSLRIAYLRAEALKHASKCAERKTLTMAKKLEFLARVVWADPGALGEGDGDLVQSVELTESGKRVRIVDKIAAIRVHNDLSGDGAEAKGAGALGALGALVGRLRG